MKKLLFNLILFVGLSGYSQIINVSTGIDNLGNSLSQYSPDPDWVITSPGTSASVTALVSDFVSFAWEPSPVGITNANWINQDGTQFINQAFNGINIYERNFIVPNGVTNFTLNFAIAYDDAIVSLEIVKPDLSTIPLTVTPTSSYHLSTIITDNIATSGQFGNWKIQAMVNHIGGQAGFLLSGTIAITAPCDKWALCGNTATATDFLGTTNAQPLSIKTNNIDRAIITPTGEMGIGTMSPTSQLEVTTSNLTVPAIIANGQSVGIYAEATAQESNLIKRSNQFGDLDGIAIFGNAKYTSNTTNGSMYGVVGSATELTSINNVGVFGEAKNANGYNNGVTGYVNSLTGVFNAGVVGQVELNTTAVYNRGIWGIAPVATNHYAGYFDGNVDMQSGTVRIGNVTTPTGYKLFVEQGILTEKVKVAVATSPAWADYVFAADYNLKSLSEVEAFIKENKHLPNVPSADELVKEGLDLGKMQATQMEKIEELTLYMIEMKKEINTLKEENQSLKVLVSNTKN
jgi:hypothetical protein